MISEVLFLHGRPGPHPAHAAMARSVGAEFLPVDFRLRHHDRPSSRLRRYASIIACGLELPFRGDYKLYLTEGSHSQPVVSRRLGLLGRRRKLAALMASETLYFISTGRYSTTTCRRLISVLGQFDAIICAGPMQRMLAEELLPSMPDGPRLYEIPIGIDALRLAASARLEPNLSGKQLVCVANGPGEFRAWYKGLDLVAAAFDMAARRVPDIELAVAGEWDEARRDGVRAAHPLVADRIRFVGPVSDMPAFLAAGALGVHLARGDAFPVATLEALAAGLPLVVSEWTGTRGAVEQVDPSLVVPLDPAAAADRIVKFFSESLEARQKLSAAARSVGAGYTERRMIEAFQSVVAEIVAEGRPAPVSGGVTHPV